MFSRFRLAACLASFMALIAGRNDADAASRVDRAVRPSAVLYTDGFIIRMVEGDADASAKRRRAAPSESDPGDSEP